MSTGLREASNAQYESTVAILERRHLDFETPLLVAKDIHDRVVEAGESSPERDQLDCCAGCYFCCSMPVDVSVPEALRIADQLRRSWPAEKVEEVATKLAANEARIRKLSFVEHTKTLIQCAFLAGNGSCTIYDARPVGCVQFTSKAVATCKQMYEHPSDLSITTPQDQHLRETCAGASTGLRKALKSRRLDAGSYELHSAVRFALENPNAGERWSSGERHFRSCIDRDPDNLPRADLYEVTQAEERATREESTRVGRNDPCPCGSGRKFKKCCGLS